MKLIEDFDIWWNMPKYRDTEILAKEFAAQQTRIVPVKIENGKAVETKYRGSAMLRGLVQADALAVISAGDNPAGSPVRLLDLPW